MLITDSVINGFTKCAAFQSKAQRRKFYALKGKGEMTQKTIDEWEDDTPKGIPERVKSAALQQLIRGIPRAAKAAKRVASKTGHGSREVFRELGQEVGERAAERMEDQKTAECKSEHTNRPRSDKKHTPAIKTSIKEGFERRMHNLRLRRDPNYRPDIPISERP